MRLKIRCDGECENFCKIFWELNKAQESWRVKVFSRLTKIIEKNTKICNVK